MGSRRIILTVIGLILTVLMVIAYRTLYPAPRNIAAQKVDFILSAKVLSQEMSSGVEAKTYGDKVIQTFGRISGMDGQVITLEDGVVVHLLDIPDQTIEIGDSISVKGRCIGYDDLLEEVKLDQASILEHQ